MRRQYEFSVDSFHILLDTLFLFYDCAQMPISDNFYPTVVGESMYGDFDEAIYHLHKKMIATRNPEEIRGGGLLKYCNLLCRGYSPAWPEEVKNMERYMCSRFFIDFSDIHQQQGKLENYFLNHFHCSEEKLKYEYLMILYQVVDESTVCLMGHERRLTLALIEDMAFQVYNPDNYNHHSSSNSFSDSNLLSPMSMSDTASVASVASSSSSSSSSAASSTGSLSGYNTPQKPETPTPTSPPSSPPTTVQTPSTLVGATPASLIPTYEIITSCQPAVVYSNGYYYTSFVSGSNTNTVNPTTVTTVTGPCLACSCHQWSTSNVTLQQQYK